MFWFIQSIKSKKYCLFSDKNENYWVNSSIMVFNVLLAFIGSLFNVSLLSPSNQICLSKVSGKVASGIFFNFLNFALCCFVMGIRTVLLNNIKIKLLIFLKYLKTRLYFLKPHKHICCGGPNLNVVSS